MSNSRGRVSRTFRWLHGAWALLGTGVSAMLVLAGGGHPPPIIFLPVVLAVWVAGHASLWAAAWLARRGARDAPHTGWPAARVVAAVGCGLVTLLGVVQLVVTLLQGEPYPYRGELWLATMAVWTLHGVCFAALLLRKRWARPLAALLSSCWAAFMAWQIVDHMWRGRPIFPAELVAAAVIVAAMSALAVLVFRSR